MNTALGYHFRNDYNTFLFCLQKGDNVKQLREEVCTVYCRFLHNRNDDTVQSQTTYIGDALAHCLHAKVGILVGQFKHDHVMERKSLLVTQDLNA